MCKPSNFRPISILPVPSKVLKKLVYLQLSSHLNSFLFSHITQLADSYSTPGFPSSGVPQGSVFGPSIYSAFINNLPSILSRDSTVLFADTTIYIVSDSLATIQSSLQPCLGLANLWLQRNGLRINAAKTKSMLIHSSRKVVDGNLTLKVDDRTVECVWSFKFLGVVVNDTLTWADHIDIVCKKVSRSLNLLRRLSWFCLGFFCFFISSHTFFPTLTTVMLFGWDVLKPSLFALNPC